MINLRDRTDCYINVRKFPDTYFRWVLRDGSDKFLLAPSITEKHASLSQAYLSAIKVLRKIGADHRDFDLKLTRVDGLRVDIPS